MQQLATKKSKKQPGQTSNHRNKNKTILCLSQPNGVVSSHRPLCGPRAALLRFDLLYSLWPGLRHLCHPGTESLLWSVHLYDDPALHTVLLDPAEPRSSPLHRLHEDHQANRLLRASPDQDLPVRLLHRDLPHLSGHGELRRGGPTVRRINHCHLPGVQQAIPADPQGGAEKWPGDHGGAGRQ